MKVLFLTTVSLLACVLTLAQTMYPAGVPGCVARYPFSVPAGMGDTLIDASGNANMGITHDVSYTTNWRGVPNAAAKFNGTSSFAVVPDTAALRLKDLTMVALFRLDDYNQDRCQTANILSKGYGEFSPGAYGLQVTDQLKDNDCDTFSPDRQTTLTLLGGSVPAYYGLSTYPVPLHKWYLVVSVYEALQFSCYFIEMDSNNMLPYIMPPPAVICSASIDTNHLPLTVGKSGDPNFPYWFNGAIDEIAIFDRGLTSDEIYKIYYFLFFGHPLGIGSAGSAQATESVISADGILTVQTNDGRPIGDIALYNVQGQIVMRKAISLTYASLNIAALPSQMYYLKVRRNNAVKTFKIASQ